MTCRGCLRAASAHDLERLASCLLDQSKPLAAETGLSLIDGLQILKRHSLIGRLAEHGLRELLISRGRSGYVALHRSVVVSDTVIVLAIRHQREAG